MSKIRFVVPRPNDILCGRSYFCQKHEGNKNLQKLVKTNLKAYIESENKAEKSAILRGILRFIISQGGHFLKKYDNTDLYYECSKKAAR